MAEGDIAAGLQETHDAYFSGEPLPMGAPREEPEYTTEPARGNLTPAWVNPEPQAPAEQAWEPSEEEYDTWQPSQEEYAAWRAEQSQVVQQSLADSQALRETLDDLRVEQGLDPLAGDYDVEAQEYLEQPQPQSINDLLAYASPEEIEAMQASYEANAEVPSGRRRARGESTPTAARRGCRTLDPRGASSLFAPSRAFGTPSATAGSSR
jgi:hypothetical protein